MQKRIVVSNWMSKFTDDPTLVDEENNIYLADKKVGSKKWIEEYGSTIFHILCEYYGKYIEAGERFSLSSEKKKQNEDVLAISNGFRLWFDQKLVKTNNKRDYITLQHLSKEFKHSEFWKNKPKTQKRMGALAYLTSKIRNDKKMNYFYRKEKNSKATGRIYGGIYVSHILNNPIYDHHNNHNNNHSDNSNFLNMDVDDEESSENCEKNNINETNDSTKKKKKKNKQKKKIKFKI